MNAQDFLDLLARRGIQVHGDRGALVQWRARISSEVLGVACVGRHDDLFELGGHSLLAIRLVERMRREDLHADVAALFTATTPAALAAAIGAGREIVL